MVTENTETNATGWVDIARVLLANKWRVLGLAILGVFLGIAYSLVATKWYRAETLLVPTAGESAAGLTGNLGALGGLIGIGGIGGGESKTTEAVAMFRSGDFVGDFIVENDLLPVLFGAHWDPASGNWTIEDPDEFPDVQDGVRLFQETVLSIAQDPQTGLVRVIVDWEDPAIAAEWANSLVDRLNKHMRDRALSEAQSNIEYLESELGDSPVAALRSSISSLLEAELEKVMLARGNSEFVFRVIDTAIPPKDHTRPRLLVVVFLSTVFFALMGVFIALANDALTRAKSARQ